MHEQKKKEELLKAARNKVKNVEGMKGVYINEDLTDFRSKMCAIARGCQKVKNVITNNGSIVCFLKDTREGQNIQVRLNKPEDLAELTGESVSAIRKKLGLAE